jgi:hypothetical protein
VKLKNWKRIYNSETLTGFEQGEIWQDDDDEQTTVENAVKKKE